MRSLGTSRPRTRRRSAKTVCRRSVFFVSSFFVPSVLLSRNFVARREDFFACHLPQATCHSRPVWLRPCRARFDRLLIPKEVRTELYRPRVTKHRIRALRREYAFIDKCDDYNQSAVEVLLIQRRSRRTQAGGQTEAVIQHKDRGEAEVAVQAAEFGATA